MNKCMLYEIKLHMSPYKVSATMNFKESKSRIVVAPDQGTQKQLLAIRVGNVLSIKL